MDVRILGCSGGIGFGLKTTSILVDKTTLIDAGTGVEQLTAEEMLSIRRVFLTHAHMDHICCLPMLIAAIYDRLQHPLQIYASTEVIVALKADIFNWTIWPDFTQLPTPETSKLEMHAVDPGEILQLPGFSLQPVAVNHPSPTQGYLLQTGQAAFAFTGDSYQTPDFWQQMSAVPVPLKVMVDVSFPVDCAELAEASGHYTPTALWEDLSAWPQGQERPTILVSHLKPGYETQVINEVERVSGNWPFKVLEAGQVFSF